MANPQPLPARIAAPSVDEILEALAASGVLETLEISHDDLATARSDSSMMETLAVTHELLAAFDDAGVLDTFFRLPRRDQANFLRWIGATDDPGMRGHRTETFVSALRAAPLDLRPAPEERRA